MAALCLITSKIGASVTLCHYFMVKSCLLSLVNSLISLLDQEVLPVGVVLPQIQSSLLFKLGFHQVKILPIAVRRVHSF